MRTWLVKTGRLRDLRCARRDGALLLVARVGAAEPASNTSFLLNSVAAVVLGGVSLFGGRATIAGPVVGALLLTALVNGLTLCRAVASSTNPSTVGIVVVRPPS